MLTAELLLPYFINILEHINGDMSQIKTKISALEVINVLIQK